MKTENFDKLVDLQMIHQEGDQAEFSVKINPSHPIFEGHFPERAILPGVTMIEIFRRATEIITGKSLAMFSAKNIKFLKMVEPGVINQLNLNLRIQTENQQIKAQGQLYEGDDIYFKEMVTFTNA